MNYLHSLKRRSRPYACCYRMPPLTVAGPRAIYRSLWPGSDTGLRGASDDSVGQRRFESSYVEWPVARSAT